MKLWNTKSLLTVLAILVYILLWLPTIVVVVLSFSSNRLGIKWEGFTTQWYFEAFGKSAVIDALIISTVVAAITIVVATTLGTLAAYGLYKYKFRGRTILRTSILLPLVMPWVVIGAALLVFFTRVVNIPLGYPSIIIAHISFSIPLVTFIVLGRMQRFDWTLEEASMDLGANRLTTWRKITIPMLKPAIITSAVLVFPWSFDEFVITYFVAGVGNMTLPLWFFSQLRYGHTAMINAIATFVILVSTSGLLLLLILQKKMARQRG